jgi:hypothetical protein
MLLCCLSLMLACQTRWLLAFAKLYCGVNGIFPGPQPPKGWFNHLTLERGSCMGGGLLLLGFGINLSLPLEWLNKDVDALEIEYNMRMALWGSTLMILGVQAICGSFF